MRLILGFVFSFSAFAGEVILVEKSKLDRMAAEHYAQVKTAPTKSDALSLFRAAGKNDCDQDDVGRSCMDVACGLMSSSYCDDIGEIEWMGQACRGNRNGDCLREACSRMSSSYCDDPQEVERMAASCRGSYDGSCLNEVCGRMTSSYCDDPQEVERMNKACQGVDADCVNSVCDRLSSSQCDDPSELERIASSCRGT